MLWAKWGGPVAHWLANARYSASQEERRPWSVFLGLPGLQFALIPYWENWEEWYETLIDDYGTVYIQIVFGVTSSTNK